MTTDTPREIKNNQKEFYRYILQYTTEDLPTKIRLEKFYMVKETEKWYFISYNKFFVPQTKHKRIPKKEYNLKQYAWSTKGKAIEHLKRRLAKRIKRYKFWARECNNWLEIIKENIEFLSPKTP